MSKVYLSNNIYADSNFYSTIEFFFHLEFNIFGYYFNKLLCNAIDLILEDVEVCGFQSYKYMTIKFENLFYDVFIENISNKETVLFRLSSCHNIIAKISSTYNCFGIDLNKDSFFKYHKEFLSINRTLILL